MGFIKQLGGFLAGAALGALSGLVLLLLVVFFGDGLPARQQYEARRVYESVPEAERLELRSVWMEEQLARLLADGALMPEDLWRDYSVIAFPQKGRQLVCAPDEGPVDTGFIVSGSGVLRTVMPWDKSVSFDVIFLCSIRI